MARWISWLLTALGAIDVGAVSDSQPDWTIHHGDGFSVRTKPTAPEVCAGEPGISGYVDWDENHMFFWAFETRSDPVNDPIILWLTGGPGASGVAFGALEELGPCVWDVADSHRPQPSRNRYSWNSNATVIFVDQPLGVGYSYGSTRVRTLAESTAHLEAFVDRLFAARPDWAVRDFYIAGESYGGSYVPSLAARIHRSRSSPLMDLASSTSSRGSSVIRLRGMLIGNGLVNQIVQRRGFYEMGCTGDDANILNGTQCRLVAETAPRCERLEEACRESGFQHSVCAVSDAYCQRHQWHLISQTPWNPYDVRVNCSAEPDLCVDPPSGLVGWLDSPVMRDELGVDEAGGQFVPISEQLARDFQDSGEVGYPSHPWVTEVLDAGLRVLIYVGNRDWLCNGPGMRYLVDGLSWTGGAQFRAADYLPVYEPCSDGAGEGPVCPSERLLWGWHKRHGRLSFMEIDGAGHMVPRDQPEVALAMLNYWLAEAL